MGYLEKISYEITHDGSVGLYDKNAGDILHSKSGALREANDKFIEPIKRLLINFSDDINILDVCYGVGYNSKAALLNFGGYNLTIDALELNKDYIFLSPFIMDGIDDDNLKLFLLNSIYNSIDEKAEILNHISDIAGKEYKDLISPFTKRFIESFYSEVYKTSSEDIQEGLLHNIYYKYISDSMKNDLKTNNYKKSKINFFLGDARKTIFNTTNMYDVIFLDAFSPQKDATLWTIDFLAVIKSKMKPNSILLSYSKSAPFRSALLELGFFVGKTFIDNSDMGTAASLNSYFIQNKLTKEDLNILETRSGIPYRDINLSLPSSAITINRSMEGAVSSKISRTQFDKIHS